VLKEGRRGSVLAPLFRAPVLHLSIKPSGAQALAVQF